MSANLLEFIRVSSGNADACALMARLHEAAFRAQDEASWSPAAIAELMAMPGAGAGLATLQGTPVGFVLWRTALDEAEILTICVDPASRKRGIGGALLGQMLAWLAEAGTAKVFLEVREDNLAAIKLYGRFAFQEIAKRKNYYQTISGNRVDALSLALTLKNQNKI